MKVIAIFPDSVSVPNGGLGIQFKNVHQRLKDRVDFYVAGYPDGPNGIDNYIGVSHPIPSIQHGSLNTLLGHTVYLAEALKFPKPDFVHAYDWSTYFAGYYLAKHHNVPLLLSMNLSANALATVGIASCVNLNTDDGWWLHRTHVDMEWFCLGQADKIINVSNGYARYFSLFKDKTTIIPNGIDLTEWKPKKRIKLPGNRKYKVIYIGRFAIMKSIKELLEAELPEDIDLIFVGSYSGGDGCSISNLEKALETKSGLHYYGPAYNQDKVDIMFSADAVIIPSKHEPFGIVALEALASENVLLASRVDGLGDFLDDSNSIDCGITPETISKALYDFTQLTDTQKSELISNGKSTCEKYNWDLVADQYYQLYESMLTSEK
jgi:glycogen(starch) synthase